MAVIDSKKLLPPSKKGASIEKQKFLVPIKNISTKKITGSDLKPVNKEKESSGSLVVVRKKIIKLGNLINNNLLIDQKEKSTKRKEEEKSKAEKREKDIEKKVKRNDVKFNLIPSIPGGSIFDVINRFIGFTLLGYLFNKYAEYLPKLLELGKKLEPAAKFVEDFSKNILKGVIGFIEFGYKTYDSIHDSIKKIGGEGAAKTFDELSKNLNLVLTGAVATAALVLSTSPNKGKLSPQGTVAGAQGALGKPKPGTGGRPKVTTSGGRGLGRFAIRSKGIARFTGKTFGRIPIIGGLVNFLFALWSGEKPGKAAARAVGSTIGSALGTFVPVPFAGTILGGILGDIVGGALYDTVAGQPKPQAKAQGGVVTRGGQSQVSPKRKIKTARTKQVKRISPQKTQPGKDVGGKLKIEQLYGTDEPGKRSALRALKKSSEDVKKIKSLGGLPAAMFGAGIDMSLGQRPDKNLANSLGGIFGSVIQSAVDAELNSSFGDISRSLGMANGGVVPSREIGNKLSIGERVGKFISKALAISIESSATKILQNLNREMQLEGDTTGTGTDGGDGEGGGEVPPELLAAGLSQNMSGYLARLAYLETRIRNIPNSEGSPGMGYYQAFPAFTQEAIRASGGLSPRDANFATSSKSVMAWIKTHNIEAFEAIQSGNFDKADKLLKGTWPSLPGGSQSQPPEIQKEARKYLPGGSKALASMVEGGIKPSQIPQTSAQGWRWGKMHKGIDLDGGDGSPISSAQNGKIIWAGDKGDGYGNSVVIRYSNGSETRFAHLKSINVRSRQTIKAGQMIGRQGNTGSSTASHLHFEYYPNGGAMSYSGYGNAAAVKDNYFRYGGNVKPKITNKPLDQNNRSSRPPLNLQGLGLKQNPKTGIWEKASLAPSQSSTVASLNRSGVLKEDTSTTIYNNNAVAILPIEVGMQA